MPGKLRAGIVAAGLLALTAIPARAQGLGGYGSGASTMNDQTLGMNGSLVIPYAGMYRGFMPSRMAGAGPLSLSTRETSEAPRKPLSLGGGMGSGPVAGMGMKADRVLLPSTIGPRLGPGPMRTGGPSMGVMPPNLGSPFRPPTIFSIPAAGPGMSM